MQTELSQIISLTSYGNEFLKTGHFSANYYPGNTTFQFCNLVDFRDFKKKWFSEKLEESVSAGNPLDWFKKLKKDGCTKVRLYYTPSRDNTSGPEYNLAGFAGGAGIWLMETIFGNYSHYWQKRWQVINQNAVDGKIWSVNYARTVQKSIVTNQQLEIAPIIKKFKNVLADLLAFCAKQDLKYWSEHFQKASDMISSQTPNTEYYHHDLLVTQNYSLEAQQLLFAAGQSWVFGGMGSWNDMRFENKEVNTSYLQLSQRLYDLLLQGVIASVNSF
jgi:hypothetical protein